MYLLKTKSITSFNGFLASAFEHKLKKPYKNYDHEEAWFCI